MIKLIFIGLFIIAVLAGFFVFFSPSQDSAGPIKFLMDSLGIGSLDSSNAKKTQQIDMTRSTGVDKARQKMDDLDQKLEEERQKAQDQQLTSQQRIEDQEQRIQTQENH